MKKAAAKKPEKYLTEPVFEKHMASIAKSFGAVDERLDRHEKTIEIVVKGVRSLQESNAEIKRDIQDFIHHTGIHERRIDNLTERVEKLEKKVA